MPLGGQIGWEGSCWEYFSDHIRNFRANPHYQAGDVDDIPMALLQVGEGELGR